MTKAKALPPLEIVESYLDYNPETGIAYWKRKTHSTSNRIKIGFQAGSIHKNNYIWIQLLGNRYAAHRLFWLLYYKEDPGHKFIDHIDRNKLNNKITNLRLATRSENALNVSPKLNNNTGIVGVFYNNNAKKFQAQIKVNRKQFHLGYFEKIEDAIAARKKAEIMYM